MKEGLSCSRCFGRVSSTSLGVTGLRDLVGHSNFAPPSLLPYQNFLEFMQGNLGTITRVYKSWISIYIIVLLIRSHTVYSKIERKSESRRGGAIADRILHNAPDACEIKIICEGKEVIDRMIGWSSPRRNSSKSKSKWIAVYKYFNNKLLFKAN